MHGIFKAAPVATPFPVRTSRFLISQAGAGEITEAAVISSEFMVNKLRPINHFTRHVKRVALFLSTRPTYSVNSSLIYKMWGRAAVARLAHNQEVAGSIPAPATKYPPQGGLVRLARLPAPFRNGTTVGVQPAARHIFPTTPHPTG